MPNFKQYETCQRRELLSLHTQINTLHANMGGRDSRPERIALVKCMAVLNAHLYPQDSGSNGEVRAYLAVFGAGDWEPTEINYAPLSKRTTTGRMRHAAAYKVMYGRRWRRVFVQQGTLEKARHYYIAVKMQPDSSLTTRIEVRIDTGARTDAK